MQIIDRVEINYFRSVGSLTLSGCRDVNVITGPNDAGKSNILKALNLFFNNETEKDDEFDFLTNLNREREKEARAAKGRMTIWMKVYFNNFLKWKSLPSKFYVKRSWNRYQELPTDTYPTGIPPTTMGRFLNKLEFHYIPAVRNLEIYGDLLADLHDTLVRDESVGLRDSSAAFVGDLDKITEAMSEKILARLKIESRVNIPGDLQEFFRALDFSTKFNNFDIPLQMRGDGIQGRHIPFILDYISSKSKLYHIWGYEEPENSLEMSKAYEMADDFRDRFSQENQIFLTTHSPAFYDIRGASASRWLIESVETDGKFSPVIQPISSTEAVDKSLGLVAVIAPRIREMHDDYVRLEESLQGMNERVAQFETAIVFVEGPTDVKILKHARAVLGIEELVCEIVSANGASEITAYLKTASRIKTDVRPIVGVYDADATGREEFAKHKAVHKVDGTEIRIIDKNKRLYTSILTVPDHLIEVQALLKSQRVGLPLPIEFMFPATLIHQAVEAGVLVLRSKTATIKDHELPFEVKIDEVADIPDEFRYLLKTIEKDTKVAFAEWVILQDAENFEHFRITLNEIKIALQG